MASTKKSKKEAEKKKSSAKTPIKKTPSKSPKNHKHKNNNNQKNSNNNKNKIPNGKAKESPLDSISIVSSSSFNSVLEVQEVVPKKELKNKNKPRNPSSRSKSSKTEKTQKRKLHIVDDIEEGENGAMCIFPMSRIKRIIKTEDTGSKLPHDVVFLVNKATEIFIEEFCEEAYKCSVRDRKKSLAYKHLSSVVSDQRRFDFLSDFAPKQVNAEEALKRRKLMETGQN